MDGLCKWIIHAHRAGEKPAHIAYRLEVSWSTVYSAKRLFEDTGEFTQRQSGRRPPSVAMEAFRAEIVTELRKI